MSASWNDENGLSSAQEREVIIEILEVLDKHADDGAVCAKRCNQICLLARSTTMSVVLMKMGAAEAILKAVVKHFDNAKVCRSGCDAFMNLAWNNAESKAALMKIGAADIIMNAMTTHAENAEVCLSGCGAFRNLTTNNADNQAIMMKMGVADVIIKAISRHADNAEVCEQGYVALMNLAQDDGNTMALMKMGAADIIMNAMAKHVDNAEVCRLGCGAIRNLTVSAENQVTLMKMGAADFIIKTMTKHADNAGVCKNGCGVFWNLSSNADNNVVLMKMGAVDVIIKAMAAHAENAEVCRLGCGAFWNLSANNADNQVALMKMGAADVVLKSITKHADSAEVCRQGCGALRNLSLNTDNKVILMKMGTAEVIMKAMIRHHHDEDVCECGSGALSHLLASIYSADEWTIHLLQNVMQSVIQKHSKNTQIQSDCKNLLEQLTKYATKGANMKFECALEEAIHEKYSGKTEALGRCMTELSDVLGKDAIGLIVKAMKAVPEAQVSGLNAIRTIFKTHQISKDELKELSTIEVLCGASRKSMGFLLDSKQNCSDIFLRLSAGINALPDISELLQSLAHLNKQEEMNALDVELSNLKLTLELEKMVIDEQTRNSSGDTQVIMPSGKTFDKVVKEFEEIRHYIDEMETSLGTEVLTKATAMPNWREEAEERDKLRERFVKMADEIQSSKEVLMKTFEKASQPSSAILEMEESMIEAINKLHPIRESAIAKSPIKKQGWSDESWYLQFREAQLGRIAQEREKLRSNLSKLNELIKETNECAHSLNATLVETHEQFCEPNFENTLKEAELVMKGRKDQNEIYAKKADDLRNDTLGTSLNVEKEREHHERRIELRKLIEKLEQVTRKLGHDEIELKKLNLNLEENGYALTGDEIQRLQSKMRYIEAQLQNLNVEQEEIQQQILLLSRNISASRNAEVSKMKDKFDFPELPLISQMITISGQFQEKTGTANMIAMLQRSGLFVEKSLATDYILLNNQENIDAHDFPDEIREAVQISKIQASPIEIARMKGARKQAILESIKVLRPFETTDFITVRSAILLANRIQHPSILPIEAVFVDEYKQKVFIQTPFQIGGSMKHWLGRSKRPLERKLEALSKVADALNAIHSREVAHCNIKLENIVMDSNDDSATPAICDFDASRDVSGMFGETTVMEGEKKIETILYMPPEIFEGKGGKATKESDVWSFVMICLIALAYDGKYDQMPMLEGRLHQDRIDIAKALKDAKRNLVHASNKPLLDLFERGLNRKMNDRPSMKEIKNVLMHSDLCECVICGIEVNGPVFHRRIEGCECSEGHFFCRKHFRDMVAASAENGEVKCMECKDGVSTFSEKTIFECGGVDALSDVWRARERRFQFDLQTRIQGARIEGEQNGKDTALKEAAEKALSLLQIRVAQIRLQVENIALPQCPRCKVAVEHVDACAAMKCSNCKCGFCMFCLRDCGYDAHTHVKSCTYKPDFGDATTDWGSPEESRAAILKKLKQGLEKFWNNLPNDETKREAAKDAEIKGWMESYKIQI